MKVREALGNSSNMAAIPGKDDRRVSDSRETSFHGQMRRVESRNYEEKLRELVDKIMHQGEKLGKKVDIRELKVYKKYISEFLDEAVNNSHKFSKQSFMDRRGRHRVYAVIKKINTQLDLLTQEVLKDQKDNLGVLQRIDDIRGLILDIIM